MRGWEESEIATLRTGFTGNVPEEVFSHPRASLQKLSKIVGQNFVMVVGMRCAEFLHR